jgi:uncharacterized membrane protein HdeD (DUF308 family)
MLIGAIAQLATRLLVPGWKGTGLQVRSAILYGAAGILVMANPKFATITMTALLAFALILSGGMRIGLTAVMPLLSGWGFIAASGLVTVAVGIAFLHLLLVHPVWLFGVLLAADLTFQGAMAVAIGIALKGDLKI